MLRKVFILSVMFLFQGCFATMSSTKDASILGKWMIESIAGTPVAASTRPAYMEFSEENRISGNASCNRFFGKYTIDGEKIFLSEAGSTRMMCVGPLNEQENRFLSTFSDIESFEIDKDSLILKNKQGDELIKAVRENK